MSRRVIWFWLLGMTLLSLTAPVRCTAADDDVSIISHNDQESGFKVYALKAGRTELKIVPEAGANAYSLKFAGRELQKTPNSLKELPGFGYGNPLLYPMPNRVRDAQFTYQGKTFKFPANNNGNFLHGLVHSVPWKVDGLRQTRHTVTCECSVNFQPGNKLYEQFPFEHSLHMTYEVRDDRVQLKYTVKNSGKEPLPFGFAFHPWFLYLGARENTFLTIPATHHMESPNLLPTGKLEELAGSKFDAREPHSLKEFVIDDVYFGMTPEKPTIIDHRDAKLRMSLKPTADFTHLVVYTPREGWFCVENQTCSTDAHNLFAKGFPKESHLQIVAPGKEHNGSVELRMETYK